MFSLEQIAQAHQKVRTGADFPHYIQEIKSFGVIAFETCVKDSHTVYFGNEDYSISSKAQYADLDIAIESDAESFKKYLKAHQQGQTDYYQFCKDCAETGIEKWMMCLNTMTCIYFNLTGNEILSEKVPH